MSKLRISTAELRQYEHDVLESDLAYFSGKLAVAARRGYKHTVHSRTFTAAVGGMSLLEWQPCGVVSRQALQRQQALELVGEHYPKLAERSETDWQDALDEIWQTVQYRGDAVIPADRTAVGYIELLEDFARHTAYFKN